MSSMSGGDAVRPTAATLNSAIRRLVAGCRQWTPAALAELHRLQTAYLDAQRAEERLGQRDVVEVA
jgi:hypothetical protein